MLPEVKENPRVKAFGRALRQHRLGVGMSQESLAARASVSTRHLSFLENGRAQPSRAMALALGAALDLPLRERNVLMQAGGYAAAYADDPLAAETSARLDRAINLVLDQMEPFGAVVVDRAWNLVRMNRGAGRLLATFLDMNAAPPEVLRNLVIATLHPRGLRPAIENFEEVASSLLERGHREGARYPADPDVARVRALIREIPDLPAPSSDAFGGGPFLTVSLRRGDTRVRLFTTVATIGTPMDATAEDLRIETYFPADEASAAFLRAPSTN